MAEIRFIEEEDVLGLEIVDGGKTVAKKQPRKKRGAPKRSPEVQRKRVATVKKEITQAEKDMRAIAQVFGISARALTDRLKSGGMTEQQIIQALLDDFDNDGPLFGQLKRQFKSTGDQVLGNIETNTEAQAFIEKGASNVETWIAQLVNTCQSCFRRHGRSKTHSEWEAEGLPRSRVLICCSSRINCKCKLIPTEIAGTFTELREPLKRQKKKIEMIAKEKGVKNIRKYTIRKLGRIENRKDPIIKEISK